MVALGSAGRLAQLAEAIDDAHALVLLQVPVQHACVPLHVGEALLQLLRGLPGLGEDHHLPLGQHAVDARAQPGELVRLVLKDLHLETVSPRALFRWAACCRTLLAACPAVPTVMRTGCSRKSAAKRSIRGGMVAENNKASHAAETAFPAWFSGLSDLKDT